MKTVKGNGVSIGTAIGAAFIYENEIDLNIEAQLTFEEAVKTLTEKFNLQIKDFKENERKDEADVLDAYILIMQDPEVINGINEDNNNSVADVFEVFKTNAEILQSMDDEYFSQRAEDLLSVGKHLINTMQGITSSVELENNSIIVAVDLTPADTSSMNMSYINGIILKEGGTTSHAVIVAKNLGIPCIIGIGEEINIIKNKDAISIDGETGEININPDDKTIKEINERSKMQEEIVSAFTQDIYEASDLEFRVNVGSNEEINSFDHPFLNSIGLFRSEFIYLDRSSIPTTEEQKTILENIQKKFSGTIVYRTLDIGGDKQVDYLDLPQEENPFLGVRGIRLSLDKKELFETQIESILISENVERVKIMFPMISTIEDFLESNQIVETIADKLKINKPEVGIMIETPSSTLLIEEFSKYVDFFSIGTNDLTQYIMAADRGNPNLVKYQDPLHPAVLRTLENVISTANKNNIEVSVCGEMSSDSISASALYALGLRVFSMSPSSAPFVFQQLNKIKDMDLNKIKDNILALENSTEVREELKKLNL